MSSATVARSTATSHARIAALPLQHGGELSDVHVAYETFGDVDNAPVLVLGGISAGRQLLGAAGQAGWWPGVVGSGKALDPAVHRLIGVDYLGGRGASSQPAADGDWPALSTYDQAAALAAVLDDLGIERLHAIVGASFGGMIALAFAARYPHRCARVVTFGAAHRSHPLATAVRSVQRRIVRLGLAGGTPHDAVATARALAVTTYRSAQEFGNRFDRSPTAHAHTARFPVDSWLDHHGRTYADSFAPASFLAVSQCLDLHDVDPSTIAAACHLVCFDTDTLVPPADVRALATALGERAALTTIPSLYGHDGFLKETAAVGAIIADALCEEGSFGQQSTAPPQLLSGTFGQQPTAPPQLLSGTFGQPTAPPQLVSGPGLDAASAIDQVRADMACAAGRPPALLSDGTPATHYAGRVSGNAELRGTATAAARAGIGADTQHGAVIAPIHLSSTYAFEGLGGKRAYDYTRSGNPTRDILAATIAELEGGDAGIVTATGMAAISVVLQLLEPGDLLIAAHDGYGGTYRLLRALARRRAFDVLFADLTDARTLDIIRTRRPRMVWIETPSNPLLRITDIAAVARAARHAGALCVADNTFLSPALQQPIGLGADIVVHSTTKYLNGHSDVVGGAIVTRDLALAEELGWWANCTGATGSPFDSYLTLRGLRTLHARIRIHQENTHAVVDLLHAHPAVRAVHYPGLKSHPGHDIAARQQRGFGAMVSFELHGDRARFVDGLRCFSLAESLGGVESLIAHPASMTHAAMDAAARHDAGITDSLLRLSVGIEDGADLIRDLADALRRAGERT